MEAGWIQIQVNLLNGNIPVQTFQTNFSCVLTLFLYIFPLPFKRCLSWRTNYLLCWVGCSLTLFSCFTLLKMLPRFFNIRVLWETHFLNYQTMNKYSCDRSQPPVLNVFCGCLKVWLTHVISCFTGGLKMLRTNLCGSKPKQRVDCQHKLLMNSNKSWTGFFLRVQQIQSF